MRLVDFVEDNKSVMSIIAAVAAIWLVITFVYGDVVMVSIPIISLPFWGVIVIIIIILGFSFRKIKR
jgi:hypothetical protein